MTLGRRDIAATVLTGLAVLTFFAAHEGWNVPLVGDSNRWAAGAILVLGVATCSLGTRSGGTLSRILAALGTAALVLAVVAIATGSLTVLSLLVLAFVLLWIASTAGHAQHGRRRPIAM